MVCCRKNGFLYFVILTFGVLQTGASEVDWEKIFSSEQSWEEKKFLRLNGYPAMEDKAKNELVALREKPIKESHLQKRDTDLENGDITSECTGKIDLGFILDNSGSIGTTNFEKTKSFVKNLTDYFRISPDQTRVSVMSYANSANVHFHFSRKFYNQEEVNSAIDAIAYTGGGTQTGDALAKAYTEMFNDYYGARISEARQILIILTDGQSYGQSVAQPAQQLKDIGVIIYSVGIGSGVDQTELETMASSPASEHVYRLDNFDEYNTLVERMSGTTCNGTTTYSVLCEKDVITIIIGKDNLPASVQFDNMHFADSTCRANHNKTHVIAKTPLNGCGTTYSETKQVMYYNNTLIWTVPTSRGSVITRKQSFEFKFTCAYSRLITVSGFKFQPPAPKIIVSRSGGGNFTFVLDSYGNDGYLSSSSETYPAFKSFSDRIYIQYGIQTNNTDIVVHAEECRATPSNKHYDTPQYEFIADGCDKDSTIQHHTTGLQQQHRFSIQAFRFLINHTFVYIHCDLRLCNRNSPDSLCSRNTTCSNRKRRALSSFESQRSYRLSLGPIMYREETKVEKADDKQQEEGTSSSNTVLIASLVCVVVLIVLLAITIVLLIMKRRAASTSKSREVIPVKFPADKMQASGIINGNEELVIGDEKPVKE